MTKEIRGTLEHNPTDALCELYALFTEAMGMNAENLQRQAQGQAMAYDDNAFCNIANRMRALKEGDEANG